MRERRLFTPQKLSAKSTVELDKDSSHHATSVLRLKDEQEVTLFNGDGYNYISKILQTGKTTRLNVLSREENYVESPLKITLVQCISRSEKMDITIQKATELGVFEIQPVFSERSITNLRDTRLNNKLERWEKIIISACEQSGRSTLPKLKKPLGLTEYLKLDAERDCLRLTLSPTASLGFSSVTLNSEYCELLIGPEGGMSDDEIAETESVGFNAVTVGPRILRTETAALVGITALQIRLGDLG